MALHANRCVYVVKELHRCEQASVLLPPTVAASRGLVGHRRMINASPRVPPRVPMGRNSCICPKVRSTRVIRTWLLWNKVMDKAQAGPVVLCRSALSTTDIATRTAKVFVRQDPIQRRLATISRFRREVASRRCRFHQSVAGSVGPAPANAQIGGPKAA
jgi:hypothetical protein